MRRICHQKQFQRNKNSLLTTQLFPGIFILPLIAVAEAHGQRFFPLPFPSLFPRRNELFYEPVLSSTIRVLSLAYPWKLNGCITSFVEAAFYFRARDIVLNETPTRKYFCIKESILDV
ncbi:hypothetical protein CEXT_479441 [Caerostris extrusa]|uniref:Secreted protein n=1 Tax=Caerostris extrusa TaxID=172846 RepID=A0AAV4MNM2_CAEEX|nr:hypothetical protein CEXT_479441 [Caerostris extrusa]